MTSFFCVKFLLDENAAIRVGIYCVCKIMKVYFHTTIKRAVWWFRCIARKVEIFEILESP